MAETNLLNLKRGLNGVSKTKYIKDTKNSKPKKTTTDVVAMMEKEWPEMTAEFRRLQEEQYKLFLHKQHDYGPGNISVGTMLQTPEEVKLSLTGLWFRMNDKLQRVKTLLMHGRESAVKDEPLEDAYLDVSNYGIMATIVKNGKWGK
tara:strand:+ start:2870 stop:3310 length:441 start_codon:yes stop_codon:yes gene_type:complete